jgi:CHASE3 domain sensor protein
MTLTQQRIESFKQEIPTKKGDLYRLFNRIIAEAECRKLMNEIKSELNSITLAEAKNIQRISQNEYFEFLKRVGFWS